MRKERREEERREREVEIGQGIDQSLVERWDCAGVWRGFGERIWWRFKE